MTSDPSGLDPQALENLRSIDPEGGAEFVRELVNIFLVDTPQRMAEIEQHTGSRDATKLTRAAHSIKGSAGAFGASRLAALAAEIEAQGLGSEFDHVPSALKLLRDEYERLQPVFARLRQPI
jgi:HPt (histidine-containing phosphotransfer) domain-containing protein